jgi:hypothetical protein
MLPPLAGTPADLEEEFRDNIERVGLRTARFRYWTMVIRSTAPLLSWSLISSVVTWIIQRISR